MSATITKKRRGVAGPSVRYLELIRRFPLRPISTESQLKAATQILDELFGHERADAGESDYIRVLAGLVEDFEAEREPVRQASGLEVLRHLVSEHQLKQADLAAVLGVGISAISMILSGDRPITAGHARRLARRFSVDAGLFL